MIRKIASEDSIGMRTIGPRALEKYIGKESGAIVVYRYVGHGMYDAEMGVLEQGNNENEEDFYVTDSVIYSSYDCVPRKGKISLMHGDVIDVYDGKKILKRVFIDESD